jgi:hypothetical protein
MPAIFRSARAVAIRAGVIVFGLALALLIIEAVLRIFYGALPMGLQVALRGVHITPFSDQPLAPDPLWQSDNDYLTIVRPGAQNSLQAGSPNVTFHVTSYAWWGGRVGFRSPQPEDGSVKAVVLGDSFSFCFTELEDCWVSYLRQHTDLDIANLGQPVTGSTSHARIYFDFVAKPDLKLKQPGVVIWQFYGNDFNDDYGLAALNQTAKTAPSADEPPSRPLPQSSLAIWLRQNSCLYVIISTLLRGNDPSVQKFIDPYRITQDGLDLSFGQSYVRDAFDMTQARNLEGESLSQQAILQTRDLVEQNGGKFMIVLMPAKEEVYRAVVEPIMGKTAVDGIAAPRLHLLDFCAAQHLTCLDMLLVLQPHADRKEQIYFPADPHLNAQGNQLVGAAVVEFLQHQGWANQRP